jgi:hypothetical protein
MTTAIPMDADYNPEEAFLNRWKDAETPSDHDEKEEDEDAEEHLDEGSDESPESDERGDEGSEDADDDDAEPETDESEDDSDDDATEEDEEVDGGKTVIDSEDAVVKIKVDGEEVEASIKDLKRLYGQEAALTRKSQEAAELRKKADEAGAMHVAGLEAMLQRARAQYQPYSELNFLALAKDPNISQDELAALSSAAKSSYENVAFLETELDGVIRYSQEQRRASLVAQARESHKVLSDPKTGIEGWSEPLYNEIRQFAVGAGLPNEVVDEIVDPAALKILHMAMSYAKGKKAVATPAKGPKKVDKTPKRIVKGVSAETVSKSKTTTEDTALRKLKKSGSYDDAADAFMSRWSR